MTAETLTFRCTGCGKEKDAKVNTQSLMSSSRPVLTSHGCSTCGEVTKWKEIGWTTIEIE